MNPDDTKNHISNRRFALLALCGATVSGIYMTVSKGCMATMSPRPSVPASSDSSGHPGATQDSQLAPQQQPSRILATAQAIYQLHTGGVRVLDPQTLTVRTDVPVARPLALGRWGTDEAAVLSPHPQMAGWLVLSFITPQGSVTARHRAALSSAGTRVLPGASPTELLILTVPGTRYTLDRFRIGAEELVYADADFKLQGDAARVFSAMEPGAAAYVSEGKLVRLRLAGQDGARQPSVYPLAPTLRDLRLLAAGGSANGLWASDGGGMLYRLTLAEPLPPPIVVATGAKLVFQLDAAPSGEVAVLLVSEPSGLGHGWALGVFDARGQERWRQPLPDPATSTEVGERFVSTGADYVVVGSGETVRAFDLRTGTQRS